MRTINERKWIGFVQGYAVPLAAEVLKKPVETNALNARTFAVYGALSESTLRESHDPILVIKLNEEDKLILTQTQLELALDMMTSASL